MKVDPNWTQEEAAEELEQWFYYSTDIEFIGAVYYDSQGRERFAPIEPDPFTSLYGKWLSENYINMVEAQYLSGDTDGVVLNALYVCVAFDQAIPLWLKTAFMDGYDETITNYKFKSWDDVWGKPHDTVRERPTVQRQRRELHERILSEAQKLKDAGESIGKDFFEKLGNKVGQTPSRTEDIYYDKSFYLYKNIDFLKLSVYISDLLHE